MKISVHVWSYLALFFLKREMFQTKFAEKITTHILCLIILFFENRAVYKKTRKNIVEPDRPQLTMWRTRFAC